jgi:hypothetical protein
MVMGLVLAASAPAQARPRRTELAEGKGSREEARALYDEAVRHYNVAEYDQAIEGFKAAYLITGDPSLLFNVAQSFRLKGDCDEATRFYKNFIRARPERAEEAEIAMNKCESQPRPEKAAEPERKMTLPALPSPAAPAAAAPVTPPPTSPAPTTVAPPAPAPAPAPAAVASPAPPPPTPRPEPPRPAEPARRVAVNEPETTEHVVRQAPPPRPREDDRKGLRTGGVVMMAGGAAIAGAGLFFGLHATSQAHSVEGYRGEWGPAQQATEDAGHRDARIGQVLTAAGAGSLVAGVVLYIIGVSGPSAPHVALAAGPGSAQVVWSCGY